MLKKQQHLAGPHNANIAQPTSQPPFLIILIPHLRYHTLIIPFYSLKLHYIQMIKDQLAAIKSGDINLYEHLVKVLRQMVLNNDNNSFDLFEYYSQKVKNNQSEPSPFRNQDYEHLQAYITKAKQILDKPNAGSEEEPAEPGPTGYLPNLMEESKWLEKCGVGFGEELTYLIFKSLEKFSITKQIKELRFWGKVIGSQSDYYIAQSPAEPGEEQLPPGVEPKGTGINKSTYWVCTDLTGDWKQLPIITPQQLVCSRKIKYIFTGNLDRQLFTNPQFPGTEGHLLKCQLARISYSCSIVPKTMYVLNEEKEITAAQEWKSPSFNVLSKVDSWVHFPQNILKNGRMKVMMPEVPEGVEVDEEKVMKELQEKDPLEEKLKPLSKDTAGSIPAWTVKKYGDCTEYKAMSKNPEDTVNHGLICIRSMIWRGWHTVYHNKQWITFYVGSGTKSTDGWFFPKEPEAVLKEAKDHEEQPEPNFPPEKKPEEGAEGGEPPADE